jgi:hypothetical protein
VADGSLEPSKPLPAIVYPLRPGCASERDFLGEYAMAGAPAGKDTAEFDRVKRDGFTVRAGDERSSGCAGECDREWLAVSARPLGDGVGDDTPIMFGGEHRVAVDGAGDVDAMHPGVASQDDVEQVPKFPPLSCAAQQLLGDRDGADGGRYSSPEANGSRAGIAESIEERGRGQAGPFGHLGRGHAVDE